MLTIKEISDIMSDDELTQMGMTREEWIQSFIEEDNYIRAWAIRTRLD
jgi:hypothetical protein